jgi:hypothetical protein
VLALIESSLSTINSKQGDDLLESSSHSDSDFDPGTLTTKLGLQRFDGVDTYILGPAPERLYKRAQIAHDNFEEGFLLSTDDFAPIASELAAVEAEVGDIALTNAIDAIKQTVRLGKHVKPSQKAKLSAEQELARR